MSTNTTQEELLKLNEEVNEELKTDTVIIVRTDRLKEMVNEIKVFTSKSHNILAMTGIYLFANDKRLTFRARAEDVGAQMLLGPGPDAKKPFFRLANNKPGGAVITEKGFYNMISNMPDEYTQLKITDKKLKISSGKVHYNIPILHPDEFPTFPGASEAVSVNVGADVISRLYGKTIYAAAPESFTKRPICQGLNHQVKDGTLQIAATDSLRCAIVNHDIEGVANFEGKVVPAKNIEKIRRLIKDVENISIHFTENLAFYQIGNTSIFSQLLVGAFPDTSRMTLPSIETEIHLKAGELRDMIKHMLAVDPKEASVLLMKPSEKQVRLYHKEANKPDFQEDTLTYGGSGKDLAIGLNGRYLADAVSHYGANETVKIQFLREDAPFLVRAVGGDDRNLDLVLPVRHPLVNNDKPIVIEGFIFQAQQALDFIFDEADTELAEEITPIEAAPIPTAPTWTASPEVVEIEEKEDEGEELFGVPDLTE